MPHTQEAQETNLGTFHAPRPARRHGCVPHRHSPKVPGPPSQQAGWTSASTSTASHLMKTIRIAPLALASTLALLAGSAGAVDWGGYFRTGPGATKKDA